MYGHQIRRAIETISVDQWSEIRVGSLYHALHQLESESLIEAVRTERQGRLPARTVYALTEEGAAELASLRDRALREIVHPHDPFDVALWVAAELPAAELEGIVRQRLAAIRVSLDSIRVERRLHAAKGYLPPAGEVLMRHGEARLEAELRWHEELLAALPHLSSPDYSRLTTQS